MKFPFPGTVQRFRCGSASLLLTSLLLSWELTLGAHHLHPAIAHTQPKSIVTKITELQQSDRRWIEINLSRQRLIAWEGGTPVYAVLVSTGKSYSPTRPGTFAVQTKHRYARMRGADYDVPDVPYTMYYSGNYAIHGAYWHHRFGTPVSHGCVNVAVDHARWLFNWATVGTPVVVRK